MPEEEMHFTREDKWKILGTMFEQQKQMRKIISTVLEAANSAHPDLHTGWLMRILDAMVEDGVQERMDVSRLTELLQDSPQNMSRTLRLLEKEKLLERHTDPQDRRRTYIVITEFGKAIVEESAKNMLEFSEQFLEQNGYEKTLRLEEAIADMLDNMRATDFYQKNCNK